MKDFHSSPNSDVLEPKVSSRAFLSDLSLKDADWDLRKLQADRLCCLYKGTHYESYSSRVAECSGYLIFKLEQDPSTGVLVLKLDSCKFCRVPRCPVCQWRRSLVWLAKTFKVLPKLFNDYPSARFILLTLTVRNPHMDDTRVTILRMNKAWQRLTQLDKFPAIGWVKSVEVTREFTCTRPAYCKANKIEKPCSNCSPTDFSHPHFHCLLMVPPGYFTGRSYLSKDQWIEMWKQSLRVDYSPSIQVNAVKDLSSDNLNSKAVREVMKYCVKPQDILGNNSNIESSRRWLVAITRELYRLKLISTGGVLKHYFKILEQELDDADLIHVDDGIDDESIVKADSLTFKWNNFINRYQAISNSDS